MHSVEGWDRCAVEVHDRQGNGQVSVQASVQAQSQRIVGGRGRGNALRNSQNTQKNRLYSMSVKKTRIKTCKTIALSVKL
jgi:uncharacterized protein YgbK (DUF1537 family)